MTKKGTCGNAYMHLMCSISISKINAWLVHSKCPSKVSGHHIFLMYLHYSIFCKALDASGLVSFKLKMFVYAVV